MTYAELLADNQRLRKRIIELEQENARLKGLGEPLLPESKSPMLESHKSLTEEVYFPAHLSGLTSIHRTNCIFGYNRVD